MLVTLDFETYFDSKLSLTKMTTMDYVRHPEFKVWGVGIKIDDNETQWFNETTCKSFIDEIPWSVSTLVCHNTPFDGYILTQIYKHRPKYYIDTAAMARAIWTGRSASLKECAIRCWPDDDSMRKGEELISAKGIRDLPADIESSLGTYCIQDVDLTYAVYKKLASSFPKSELDLIDLTCRMFCEPKLVVNRESLISYRDECVIKNEAAIKASQVERKVLASNKQFAELLANRDIVIPTKISPTTGKEIPAFGKNDKAFQQMQKMHPELQHIWDARLAVKSRIAETRAQRFLDATHDDGTISVPLRYYAAHTGRFGGTEKINMQNLPRKSPLRLALQAPKGKLLYVADLSQIEARMLAWLADESELVEQFRAGTDVYSDFASKVYKKPINKHDHPTERFVGKTAILGLGYGMGASKFKATLESGAMGPPMQVSEQEAIEIVGTYRTSYPGIPMLWEKLAVKLMSTINPTFFEEWRCLRFTDNSIRLPNGLRLLYNNLRFENHQLVYDSRNKETTWGGRITENVVQALSRIVITDSMLGMEKSLDGHVVLTVHDEIIFMSDNKNPDDTMEQIISIMCDSPWFAPELPLDAEGGYDISYSK